MIDVGCPYVALEFRFLIILEHFISFFISIIFIILFILSSILFFLVLLIVFFFLILDQILFIVVIVVVVQIRFVAHMARTVGSIVGIVRIFE